MEILSFVSFILWSTGLSTVALIVLAIIDWRRNEQLQQVAPEGPIMTPRPQATVAAPAAAQPAQPALLKAA
ncbi:hypothetical protein [Solimonas soli]|uniref:hypothetical protein n=1 Tax=Solimonas soli TaxID=413479 RepID=UPI00047FD741|nr:hypothetical protein [Solimonas soli]